MIRRSAASITRASTFRFWPLAPGRAQARSEPERAWPTSLKRLRSSLACRAAPMGAPGPHELRARRAARARRARDRRLAADPRALDERRPLVLAYPCAAAGRHGRIDRS